MKRIKYSMLILMMSVAISVFSQGEIQNTDSIAMDKRNLALPGLNCPRSYFGIALGATASTNGFGGNLAVALSKRFAVRLGYETVDMAFKDAFSFEQSGKNFTATPVWNTGGFSAIVDFYLLKGLYLSGGLMLTDMNLSASLKSTDALKIGDIVYQPDEQGQLSFAVKPEKKMAPYAALGFGRNISRDHRLSMSFEMGAYFTGSYVVDLSGTKFFEGNNQNETIDNLNQTLKDVSWSGIYPIIKLGISYKFYGKNK